MIYDVGTIYKELVQLAMTIQLASAEPSLYPAYFFYFFSPPRYSSKNKLIMFHLLAVPPAIPYRLYPPPVLLAIATMEPFWDRLNGATL